MPDGGETCATRAQGIDVTPPAEDEAEEMLNNRHQET
jgi:hypothetical protein